MDTRTIMIIVIILAGMYFMQRYTHLSKMNEQLQWQNRTLKPVAPAAQQQAGAPTEAPVQAAQPDPVQAPAQPPAEQGPVAATGGMFDLHAESEFKYDPGQGPPEELQEQYAAAHPDGPSGMQVPIPPGAEQYGLGTDVRRELPGMSSQELIGNRPYA